MNKKLIFQPALKYSCHLNFDFDAISKWIIYRNSIDVLERYIYIYE